MKTLFTHLILFAVSWMNVTLYAQKTVSNGATITSSAIDPLKVANEYIMAHLNEWELTPGDIAGMTLSDMYSDKSSGITRIYFQQQYQGIPVYNAILNVCMTKAGLVYFVGNRFVRDLASKVNTTAAKIDPSEAVNDLALHLGVTGEVPQLKIKTGNSKFVFEKGNLAKEDITAMLSYQPFDSKVRLAWDVYFAPVGNSDTWSSRVDAVTGKVLNEFNNTFYCSGTSSTTDEEANSSCQYANYADDDLGTKIISAPIKDDPNAGPQYNVWPAPFDDPDHGPRTMVTNPADSLASPYGWHDTNGQPGAEFTTTDGNNVFAYQDRDNIGYSSGDEPDGGPDLHFDFPYDSSWEPQQYVDAAVVNLFYWMNYMHDFSYHFGFDEASGNFQKNNYGRGGQGNDFVYAVAQDEANGDTLHNNAIYFNRNEGKSPSIFMLDFIRRTLFLTVDEPAAVAGKYQTNIAGASWGDGSYITNIPVSGEVVVVNDGVESPSTADACQDILNASEIAGKIALIDRGGGCQFGYKALQAQNAGAIGVIFCNYDKNTYSNVGAGPDGLNVHIPVVMLGVNDCRILRQYAGHGLKVTLVNPGQSGPERHDSDLQNTMMAHEFAHGISIRLAGGPDKACLDNAEQMGEGWSDFFGLVTTVKPGDTGSESRGFGTYAIYDSPNGNGLRQFPYSTDMNISPLTYGHVAANQEKHDLGEVWADMLWDMYWALSDKYGWKSDLYDESSGNYRAVRLVVDGLKNMACDPGFVDGRNAILAADEVLYNGDDVCLLWNVFARRGLGFSADQGSPYDAGDQVEAFDLPPTCSNSITVNKSVTDFIQPGDDIHVTIRVGNYKSATATNVVVTDNIPDGASFKSNSSNYAVLQQGNNLLFELGNIIPGEIDTITYTLQSPVNLWSKRIFLDDVPAAIDSNWTSYTIGTAAPNTWVITDSFSGHPGHYYWTAPEISVKSQQALMLNPDMYTIHVDGEHPALRFFHRYQTHAGINGGIIEVKEVGDGEWQRVDEDMLRNGYSRMIDYRAFLSSDVHAYSGNSGDDFKATYVDLSKWSGKDIQVRFRFATTTTSDTLQFGFGWLVDDIEFMDLVAYNTEACVTTDQGDFECAIAPEDGTIVESNWDHVSGTEEIHSIHASVYPNPASDLITIALQDEKAQTVNISLLTIDGRQLFTKSIDAYHHDFLNINVGDLPSGFYLVSVITTEGQYVSKVIIQR